MCDIIVYQEKARPVVAKRFRSSAPEIGPNWPKFAGEVVEQGIFPVGWGITEYFCEGEWNPEDVEYELCMPVMGEISPSEPLKAKTLDGCKVVSAIYRGSYDKIGPAYDEIFKWIEEQGLEIVGNIREIHLRCPHNTDDPAGFVTEIQIPVR